MQRETTLIIILQKNGKKKQNFLSKVKETVFQTALFLLLHHSSDGWAKRRQQCIHSERKQSPLPSHPQSHAQWPRQQIAHYAVSNNHVDS